jgi:hypothetical protein
MQSFKIWLEERKKDIGIEYDIVPSQGDGWRIDTNYGYIDYRHSDYENVNEIWWVESKKRGHGSELINLMMKNHPAQGISWGATSQEGRGLMNKWHRQNKHIDKIDAGPHEGQFDPF